MNENNPRPHSGPPARLDAPVVEPRHASVAVRLTKSDRDFLMAYTSTRCFAETGAEWAMRRGAAPYKNDDAARSSASRKLQEIRHKCEAAGCPEVMWEEAGLTMRDIVAVLRDGMAAMKVEPMRVREETIVQVRDAKGNVRDRVVTQERIVEAGPYVDHRSRTDAARLAATLRGDLRGNRSATGAGDADGGVNATTLYIFNIGGPNAVKVGG